MALSGVKADQLCMEIFNRQKLGQGPNNKKWICCVSYRISESGSLIEVEHIVSKSGKTVAPTEVDYDSEELPPDELWEQFRANLPFDDCRYYTYDFSYTDRNGGRYDKLCFITWAPDTARIKSKMLIASSKDSLKKSLVGISQEVQATGMDELEDYEEFAKKMTHFGC